MAKVLWMAGKRVVAKVLVILLLRQQKHVLLHPDALARQQMLLDPQKRRFVSTNYRQRSLSSLPQ